MTDVEYWEECARKAKTTESACAAWGMKIVAAERERCAKICEELAVLERVKHDEALNLPQPRAAREALLIALTAQELATKIREGER